MHRPLVPTVSASIATRCQHRGGGGSEVNMFEQVSSDGHQVLLAGVPLGFIYTGANVKANFFFNLAVAAV